MKSNKMTITVEQQMKMNRAISREIELENNMRINHNRVHKSKKAYNRKESKKSIGTNNPKLSLKFNKLNLHN